MLFFWLMALKNTDSYFSVYVLVAGMGIVALWTRKKSLGVYSGRDLACAGIVAFIISFAVFLANYQCYIAFPGFTRLLSELTIFAGGMIAGANVVLFFIDRPNDGTRERRTAHVRSVFLGCFAVLLVEYMSYLLCAAYPSYLTVDSHSSLNQIETGNYINNHPFWYTMFVKLMHAIGFLFTDDSFLALGAYGIFQVMIVTLSFSYVIVTFYQAGLRKRWLIAMLVLYGLSPYNLALAVTMWKDILFSVSILLWVVSLYRIKKEIGSNGLNYAVLCAGCAGTCLMRTNGWFVAFLSYSIFLIGFRKLRDKRPLLVMGGVIAICWVMTGPMLTFLNVGKTNYIEGLSLPLQQMVRVIFNEYELPDSDMAMLEQIFNLHKIPTEFSHGCSDPVKTVIFKMEQKEFLKEHALEYIALWIRIGVSHPTEYLKAWIELTKGYWNAGYAYEIYYLGEDMPSVGLLYPQFLENGKVMFRIYFDFLENAVWYQPFVSIGLQVWTLLVCFFLNIRWKQQEKVLAVPLLIILAGLWVGTPVFSEFRYAYPVFLTLPVILAATALSARTYGETIRPDAQGLTTSPAQKNMGM